MGMGSMPAFGDAGIRGVAVQRFLLPTTGSRMGAAASSVTPSALPGTAFEVAPFWQPHRQDAETTSRDAEGSARSR